MLYKYINELDIYNGSRIRKPKVPGYSTFLMDTSELREFVAMWRRPSYPKKYISATKEGSLTARRVMSVIMRGMASQPSLGMM